MKVNLDWLIGKDIEQVVYDEKTQLWLFTIAGQASLSVACPWQILAEDRIALASGDHNQPYGFNAPIDAAAKATTMLETRMITRACADECSADLTIELEGEVILRTFNDTSGFEAWSLAEVHGEESIAQGGGNIIVVGKKNKA